MIALATTVLWWVCVVGTYVQAKEKGRNRLVWTVSAMLVPLAFLVLWLLPDRSRPWVT